MSSVNKSSSHLTVYGMSITYKRNRNGPKIDSWGIPRKSFSASKKTLFKLNFNHLFDRYDLNQRMTFLENSKNSILMIEISWLIVSNAFKILMSVIPV